MIWQLPLKHYLMSLFRLLFSFKWNSCSDLHCKELTLEGQATTHHIIFPIWTYLTNKTTTATIRKGDQFSFSTTFGLFSSSILPILSIHIIAVCPVLDRYSHCGCVDSKIISQRSNLVRVEPFWSYSWKRWDQFLKQHAASGKNYLLKTCNISVNFYTAALHKLGIVYQTGNTGHSG